MANAKHGKDYFCEMKNEAYRRAELIFLLK